MGPQATQLSWCRGYRKLTNLSLARPSAQKTHRPGIRERTPLF
jgi:hypothetical protein